MKDEEKILYELLEKLNIKYKKYEHNAIFTVEDAQKLGLMMEGLNLKNLFLKDKKTNHFYLVILEDNKRLDMKDLKTKYNLNKLTFASEEELYNLLHLSKGAVSPFGLIYDKNNQVSVILDKEIIEATDTTLVNFHPNRNTATIGITKKDFLKYLKYLDKEVIYWILLFFF